MVRNGCARACMHRPGSSGAVYGVRVYVSVENCSHCAARGRLQREGLGVQAAHHRLPGKSLTVSICVYPTQDVYDKYDEDADGDEEITDEDEESAGQAAAATGAGPAGTEAGGSAAVPGCQGSAHGRVGRAGGSTARGPDRRPAGTGPGEDGLDREGTPSSNSNGEDGRGENVEAAAAMQPAARPAASQQQQQLVAPGDAPGVASGGEPAGTHAAPQADQAAGHHQHHQQAAAQDNPMAQEEAEAEAAAAAATPMQVERSSDLACDPHGVSVEGGGGDGSAVHQPMVAERDLPPMSSSGSAGNGLGQGLGAAGPAGSCSNMGAAGAPTGSLADSVAQRLMGVGHKAGGMQGATDLVRRTQVRVGRGVRWGMRIGRLLELAGRVQQGTAPSHTLLRCRSFAQGAEFWD